MYPEYRMFKMPSWTPLKKANYDNNPKSETSESNINKNWREEKENMLGIMIQTSLLLQFNMIINILVHQYKLRRFKNTYLIYRGGGVKINILCYGLCLRGKGYFTND